MGRVKLKIKKLENTNGRQATFAKRKHGIMKKANELSILCDIHVALLMFSPSGKPSLCCGRHSTIEEVIAKFAQVTPQERTKRKLESLEALKKTFKKLDHDVNIREFIASGNPTVEDLSHQARALQARLSETHRRISYWSEPEKINSIEHLGQLEISIRQSLDQLRAHKQNLLQMENSGLVKDWSNCLIQDGIQIPLDQQLQSLSWIANNSSSNIVTEELNLIPQRDIECSASSSFGSYSGYFGTGKSPEISISGQETSFIDELTGTAQLRPLANTQQFAYIPYNPNLPNDVKHQPLPPGLNLPMNQQTTDYHMNDLFESPGSSQARFGSSSSSMPCSVAMFDDFFFSQLMQPN
ncbi:PREDICTED: agamous-like MADS-box protein AGL30 [Tarenaya hassleriana]|uniref:agamous-like MADS-box protein AGL30 n=1 Tax=Tarenaya hassleriana TaxID=28532 RepID=UPI0008FD36E8|nr:PREDICTED: agamous-like MADS-box protein AGL30 [Tarenaya hassleriana]